MWLSDTDLLRARESICKLPVRLCNEFRINQIIFFKLGVKMKASTPPYDL